MIRKVIRLEYAFTSGKRNITFEISACKNEPFILQLETMLTQLGFAKNQITKIELLEVFE